MIGPNPTNVEVFLIDDEKDVTDALAWLLDSVKIRSSAFSSASAFLEALGSFDGAACAVVDLRMPEMSGWNCRIGSWRRDTIFR